jgi:hypothetical protein
MKCLRVATEIHKFVLVTLQFILYMYYQAFKSWSQFSNKDYPEQFCHYSGEPSDGETSVKRPILRKNWKKAQELA